MTTMMRLAASAVLGVLLPASAMAAPSAQLVVEAGDAQALTLAAQGLRHDLERIARGPHSTLSVPVCREEETAVRAVVADLSAVVAAKRQIRSVAARIVTTPGRTWLAARDFNSARDADLRAVEAAESSLKRETGRFHDVPGVERAFATYAAQIAGSESRLHRAGRLAEVPDTDAAADNATQEPRADAASVDSAAEQAFELEADDDALNHAVAALGKAADALKELAHAPCLGPLARETKARDGADAAALAAPSPALALGSDETASLDQVVAADASDARAVGGALEDLQHALKSLDAAASSDDGRICASAKAATGAVLGDLEAVLRAKQRASLAAHRLAQSASDNWDAEHAYAAAIRDERAAVLEARSTAEALADGPYDKTAAGPAFETFAMRLDSSMTWLRQDALLPVPGPPIGAPAVSLRAANALRRALASFAAALDGLRVEVAASCANGWSRGEAPATLPGGRFEFNTWLDTVRRSIESSQ
jgi:hypothetical protein